MQLQSSAQRKYPCSKYTYLLIHIIILSPPLCEILYNIILYMAGISMRYALLLSKAGHAMFGLYRITDNF